MFFWTLKSSLTSLKNHGTRTALTTLGIIIGVASLVIVTSLGHGAKESVKRQINLLGENFIVAMAKRPKHLGLNSTDRLFKQSTYDAILREVRDITLAAPLTIHTVSVAYSGESKVVGGVGTNRDFFKIRDWKTTIGRVFNDREERRAAKVVVLGESVREELFRGENPVGKLVRVNKIPMRVIGVLEKKGTTPDGRDQDDAIFIPLRTLQRRLAGTPDRFSIMLFSAENAKIFERLANSICSVIRWKRGIKNPDDDDFTLFTQKDVSDVTDATFAILNLLLAAVASVALLVGGVGIMNIMLVTVAERTREIGIRMAIGASPGSILRQFLLESVIVCGTGAVIGLSIGVMGSLAISLVFHWPFAISVKGVIIAVLASSSIGVFFGYYPALRASRLNPADAILER